ncbi:hypothetical protein D3C73_1415670 [compost metagenome]
MRNRRITETHGVEVVDQAFQDAIRADGRHHPICARRTAQLLIQRGLVVHGLDPSREAIGLVSHLNLDLPCERDNRLFKALLRNPAPRADVVRPDVHLDRFHEALH